jgi:predicted GTPase
VVVINKIDSAAPEGVDTVQSQHRSGQPRAVVIDAASVLDMDNPDVVRGCVLAVEDGPTLTHGEMKIGAAVVAARKFGATGLVDPRPYLVGRLKDTFRIYPGIGTVLPAMGYGARQLKDLEATINRTKCDAVVIGTPIDLNRIIKIRKPNTRVYYNLQEIGKPDLDMLLNDFVVQHKLLRSARLSRLLEEEVQKGLPDAMRMVCPVVVAAGSRFY